MSFITAEQLEQIVSQIWNTTFFLSINITSATIMTKGYSAYVTISGKDDVTVVVEVSAKHADLLVSQIYSKDLSAVEQAESCDLVGEIANMIGGQIKAIIPEDNKLSTPKSDFFKDINILKPEDMNLILSLSLESEGEIINVYVYQN
jgi:chemotaxis protein CheX